MRFHTRVFLFSFIPFALLLTVSFAMIQRLVQSTVGEGLRSSLRENHLAIARVRSKSDLRNSRFLRVVGENPALKAGIQLMLADTRSEAARNTVEDQLRELCTHMDFDFLLVSAPNGSPLAGVVRQNGQLVPANPALMAATRQGLMLFDGSVFQIASVSIDQADENIGLLSVGELFDFSEFTTPAVLIRNGRVLQSSIPGVPIAEVDRSMAGCGDRSECTVTIRGAGYISLPMQSVSLGGGYMLRSLQNLDSATGPVLTALRSLFLSVSLLAVLVALICSIASARTIVSPIEAMISRLRYTERTGVLPEFGKEASGIREIRDLTDSFNRAAVSVREAREGLQTAYVEFVKSLASALDARDRYTAGHSWRVSRLSCATAGELNLDRDEIERIRVGALLHDIGKIGIADSVLQKPGALTDEETALVKRHPEIGRRILEGVHGFAPFLAAVEFHHENWDGTGYPRGQSGEQTPIDARIIHVADAYDAMTTDRPYRSGTTHEQAIRILKAHAGTMFDPTVVQAFSALPAETPQSAAESGEYAAVLTR
jgi:HD-GYP domain-containing protein (c-di-GMP phosphodiesterase class II)